jgi:O-antigen/teichoic acid export membrane protein
MKETIIRNTIDCGAASAVTVLVNFFLMPFMISELGVTEYGLIGMSAIFTVGGCVSLLEMGFQSSICKYVAEYNTKNNHTKIARVFYTSAVMFLLIGVILTMCGVLLSTLFVNHLLTIPSEYRPSFRIALFVVFGSYIFQFPNFVAMGFLSGMQRFDILKGAQIVATLLYAGGVVFLLSLGHNYLSLIILQTCVLFLQFGFYMWAILRCHQFLRLRFSYFSLDAMREVFRMTKFLFIGRFSDLIYHNSPRIIIGIFLGPVSMTPYEAVIKISRIIKVAFGFVNSAIMPAASELHANNDTNTLRTLFLKTCRYQVVAVFPIVTAIMFFAQSFYGLWLGPDFTYLAPLLCIALVYNLMTPFRTVGGAMMVGMNRKLRSLTLLSVINTMLSVVVMLVLIHKYTLVAIFGGLTSSTLITLPFYLKIFFEEFNVKVRTFLREIAIVVVLVLFPLCLISVISKLIVYNDYFTLFLGGSVWCFTYWCMLYFFVLDTKDKDVFKGLMRNLCWVGK